MRVGVRSGWAESCFFSVSSRFADFHVRTCRSIFRFSFGFSLSAETATQSVFLMFCSMTMLDQLVSDSVDCNCTTSISSRQVLHDTAKLVSRRAARAVVRAISNCAGTSAPVE